MKVCAVLASPVSVVGDEHGTAGCPSSEHVTDVGLPVVAHSNVALVYLVHDHGLFVKLTVGAELPPDEDAVTCQL